MPNKNTNRPIVSFASAIEAADKKNLAARFVAFAGLEKAGATKESLSSGGEHFDEFKEGILIGWQGAAFAKKFLNTSEGKAILAGKVPDRFGGFDPVSKIKNEWATDISGKVGKMRKAYVDWAANGAVPDAPSMNPDAPNADAPNADAPNADAPNADAPNADAPNADAPTPAPKRKSGTKKALKVRLIANVGDLAKAVKTNYKSDTMALDVDHVAVMVAFNQVLELCGEKPLDM